MKKTSLTPATGSSAGKATKYLWLKVGGYKEFMHVKDERLSAASLLNFKNRFNAPLTTESAMAYALLVKMVDYNRTDLERGNIPRTQIFSR